MNSSAVAATITSNSDEEPLIQPLPEYHSILLAVDSSDHSNRGTTDAIKLGQLWQTKITAAHVYAAKLHDHRFRQMEGGLPEQFKEEEELERQRDVHDDLITKGLSIITDSYLDQAEDACQKSSLPFNRCSLEGKNYRELTRETNSGNYDLLIMGALGLGAVKGSRLGTVTNRVSRRANIDTLVIKQPECSISDGPIVVAIDGSAQANGGLLTAMTMAEKWQVPLHIISAFDPYYHYVAFNRIAGVLSEEAGKVFKFQEQEKLHEEIIDSGLAKIYQGHLDVAQTIADDYGVTVTTKLLDGKPHDAIEKYLKSVNASLLVVGKLGIHADDELDIGGNAELLLQNCECAILLSNREFQPRTELLASVTTSWTNEAETRMENVPSFVRSMARMAILRYAQEQGHTVITEKIVEEATAQLMPNHAEQAMGEIVEAFDNGELKRKPETIEPMRWSSEATDLLRTIEDMSLRGNLSMRAEKKARAEKSATVEKGHIVPFIEDEQSTTTDQVLAELHWAASALARLSRVPDGFMRDKSRERIEEYARNNGLNEITINVAEAGLAEARKAMESQMSEETPPQEEPKKKASACPFANMEQIREIKKGALKWTPEAKQRMEKIPEGFMRDLTKQRIEKFAKK
ncbi:MAG: universal stress protein, partial [Chromatiales bacterium]|nr:universal stress protein [Chromatiales bacterium]